MKCLLAPIAVVAALAIAGCGSSSTLSSDQFTGLQNQGKQFASSMQTVGADASSCAASAGKTSTGAPDLAVVKTCLASALGKAQAGLGKISAYTDNLAGEVDGNCSTELKALSAAMNDVKAIFAKAQEQALSGDLVEMQATLKTINSAGITTAGTAAEKACKS